MEIPRHRDQHGGLPTILCNDGRGHYPSSPRDFGSSHRPGGFSSFSPTLSNAMPIRHEDPYLDAPPPLPPPRFVPVEGPQPDHKDFFRREEYTESNYGSLGESLVSNGSLYEDRFGYKSRDHSAPMRARDEGYASLSSAFASSRQREGPPRFQVHDQYQFRSSADNSYDNHVLKKLDAKRPFDHRAGLSSSVQDVVPGRPSDRPYMQLKPLSLPTRMKHQPMLDSPGRYSETPATSAVSPRSTPFSHLTQSHEYRSPIDPPSVMDFERSPISRSRRTNSGSMRDDLSVSTESYDNETDFPMEETSRLRAIHLDEPHHSRMSSLEYQTIGQKRRASSPPGDEPPLHTMASQSDLLRRRDGVSRGSPTPRLTVIPQHSSVSSVSSAGRSGSYASQLSLTTSMTSAHSYGRRSPVGLSPSGLSPTDPTASPFMTPNSLTMSPRSTMSQRIGPHQRTLSEQKTMVSPRKLTETTLRTNGNVSKIQGFFMCDCCPKKPKKFESAEELSAHEAEKQYECSFCGNRFKNKNEAERHQNSLHVRRHSWSCSALSGYDRAFHESTSRPGEADACGYCGDEFVRSGSGPAGHIRHATDQDWEERIRHLQDVHKFRECNSSKKFYRADHFRQHLKHSHAGTSGKWTNMLENACMLEEEPPQPVVR